MDTKDIRNFCIIAHIDHGKSTLADRFLEFTGTVEKRKMKEQVLDSMELERERGITIKMTPVRMSYILNAKPYTLNLIDTPGHIDFSYEVSRALKAVEGAILLVDATQGVQAQTLTTLDMAENLGLKIIPAVSKIDSPLAKVEEVKKEIAKLLGCSEQEVLEVSGKTGQGVEALLQAVVEKIPPPQKHNSAEPFRSLVFDFQYSNHKGVVVYIRVVSGRVKRNDQLNFKVAGRTFPALEVGIFSPEERPKEFLETGEIGYITTGIKEPGVASVGDTVAGLNDSLPPLPGYQSPQPVVWSSIYPESQDDFEELKKSLNKLKLSDSSLSFEEEASGVLGRGFRCGFLGMLHLEIITERLKREFGFDVVVGSPTVKYQIKTKDGEEKEVYSPSLFPPDHLIIEIMEPWVEIQIIVPSNFLNNLMSLVFEHEGQIRNSENFGADRIALKIEMPLRELMRNFFDKVKSQTSGFASFSYRLIELRKAEVEKIEILVAGEAVPAFTKIVSARSLSKEAEQAVEKLHKILPRQLFTLKIQAQGSGRIIASRELSALKKNVTGHLYGGDITRKRKLWEKQKKGKKKLKSMGKVNIPQEVFLKMLKE